MLSTLTRQGPLRRHTLAAAPGWSGLSWLLVFTLITPLLGQATNSSSSSTFPAATPRPAIAAIALGIKSRAGAIQDSRCYLMNGGAVESFFISEDTPVGSIIGSLSVNGDPREDEGNILLRLQERNAAIGIAPGTKNLTLLRPLDREEKIGPSNVYVNVRCDRRRTSDPSFIIPVSVRVWDVNDNAPQWLAAPYTLRLSELTAVGSRVVPAVRAVDADAPGPHATLHYAVLPAAHSDYFGFVNELDPTLVVKKPLDYETLPKFSLTLRASDGGQPPKYNDTKLFVELVDADDQNPRFLHSHYTARIPEGAVEGTELETSPGRISAIDQDSGINAAVFYSSTGERQDLIRVDRDTGRLSATRLLLEETQPVTVVIKATQYDNPDRYALTTVTISRHTSGLSSTPSGLGPTTGDLSSTPVRFQSPTHAALVSEAAPVSHNVITLSTNTKKPLQFYVSDRSFLEKFAINSAGEVLVRRPLDYETQDQYYYQVMLTDGIHNDTTSLNITVLNENEWEPRFRHPQYEFRLAGTGGAGGTGGEGESAGGLQALGRLDVYDGDKGDRVTLDLHGPDAGQFYINEAGELFVRSSARPRDNHTALRLRATATDTGRPPRHSSVPIVVHLPPSVTSAEALSGGGLRAALCVSLAVLALTVAAMATYLIRQKRRKSATSPMPAERVGEKRPPSPHGGAGAGGGGLTAAGSLLSVSAGASTILDSSSSLDLPQHHHHGTNQRPLQQHQNQQQRFSTKTKIAPLPPVSPTHQNHQGHNPPGHAGQAGQAGQAGHAGHAGQAGPMARMSDHIAAPGAGRSGVAWPSATIPARVKKLSWDDAETDKGGAETLTEVHDATNPTVGDHMNLTVYF